MKLGRARDSLRLLGLVVVVVGCHDQVIVGIEPPLPTAAVGGLPDAGRDGGRSDTEQDEDDSDDEEDEEIETEGGADDEPSDGQDQNEATN